MNKIVLLICFNILLLGVGNTQIEGDTTIVSTSEEIKIEDNATQISTQTKKYVGSGFAWWPLFY